MLSYTQYVISRNVSIGFWSWIRQNLQEICLLFLQVRISTKSSYEKITYCKLFELILCPVCIYVRYFIEEHPTKHVVNLSFTSPHFSSTFILPSFASTDPQCAKSPTSPRNSILVNSTLLLHNLKKIEASRLLFYSFAPRNTLLLLQTQSK